MLLSKKNVLLGLLQAILVAVAVIWGKRRPDPQSFLQKAAIPFSVPSLRLASCLFGQFLGFTPRASSSKTLEGQRILITGGTRGIGFEISKGLVERGADVLIVARNPTTGQTAVEAIQKETSNRSNVKFLSVDLSDLESVSSLVEHIQDPIDQLILNAGYWPETYQKSKQGHEITYAANLLGPHLLLRKLLKENVLKPDARVIITAGELYVILKGTEYEGCSSDFQYENDAQMAYCRSKLGVMTLFEQYLERFPNLHLTMVHPGVIDTGGQGTEMVPKALLIDNENGAQTTLILATEMTERGVYYHNCLGKVTLPENDAAKNASLGLDMWELAERLIQDYL